MFIQGNDVEHIEPPPFIDTTDRTAWWAKRIANNLYTISFPDVTSFETKSLEPRSLDELAQSLRSWIGYLCEKLGCKAVVVDCHGGPDALTFAAVKVADKSLLVSEPDRVTMYGTLHFLRTLDKLEIERKNVHLVFSKIVDAVGPTFLWRLYKEHLADYFDGKPLLAAFPLELYLTTSFENHPLVTEDYPQSMLARKTQVMLGDLFIDEARFTISERARRFPGWLKHYTRSLFGRPPKLLSVNFLAAVGFALLLIVAGMESLSGIYKGEQGEISSGLTLEERWNLKDDKYRVEMLDKGQNEEWERLNGRVEGLRDARDSLIRVVLVWAALASIALVMSWTSYLDRQGTVFVRRQKYGRAASVLICQVSLWTAASIFLSSVAYDLGDIMSAKLDGDTIFYSVILFGVMGMALIIWVGHAYRGYREIVYAKHRALGLGRVFFGVAVLCGLILGGMLEL